MDEKATQLHAIASLKVLLEATRPTAGGAGATSARHSAAAATQAKETPLDLPNGGLADVQLDAIEEVCGTLSFSRFNNDFTFKEGGF